MSILTQDEYIKQAAEKYASQKNQKITDSNESYAKESETVRTLYDEKIADTNQLYEDDLRANEVQKFINEREVAENNANLGLTDSGLNRTQQTAVQLSASNNAAKIQRARQSAVDSLTREMTSMLASIESSRAGAERDINDYYEQLASQEGRAIYDTNVQAETARIQAEIEAETARRKNELEAETKRIEAEQKKTTAKNSAYATLVKELDVNNNSENPYGKNTKAALVKAYIDEHGYSDISELNALLSVAKLTATEYSKYLKNGKIATLPTPEVSPNDIFVKEAINLNKGLYYTPINLLK